ncbi:Saposin B-type domain-containing protein [Caenorhabditis elegans]|uniref:Saposin B-type domain-containing protein n=1 Tax=Caenorhabditis elegans TaxID=6239 RepID=A3FPJ3_CAEEL|nr:Saposin B-type domain-containing protein [Caenorhabditis elegans]CCD66892.1 Saposin B-type domain-containing protein [Caenorhabditis elegans]|eukprot:NP_001123123.1 Uncharacterized protein CELE_F07G6.10 [Caenorhabditis elegans]
MKFVILLLLLLPFVNSSRPDSANDYMKCEYCLKIVPICRASGDFKSAEHAYYEKIRPTYMIYKHAIKVSGDISVVMRAVDHLAEFPEKLHASNKEDPRSVCRTMCL